MLNVLLSFAQFEREVTAERIRDKIAASKRKGLWVGGMPALGYDVKDKVLVINPKEATTVRYIFQRFIALGSATLLVTELKQQGITTKSWTTQKGDFRPGKVIDKGFIYKLLHNRTYLGEISHKTAWYPGKHEAIIDPASWEAAHAILKKNRRTRANNTRATIPFLLKGLLFDTDGRALTTYSTQKKKSGKRYRYYISSRTSKEEAGSSGLPYFVAAELESMVIEEVFQLLKSPNIINEVNRAIQASCTSVDETKITVAVIQVDKIWPQLFPHEQQRIIQLLVTKVIVTAESIDIRFHNDGIAQLTQEMQQSKGA